MTKRTTEDWHGCPTRYNAEFLNAEQGVSTNILAARLLALEEEGVVNILECGLAAAND